MMTRGGYSSLLTGQGERAQEGTGAAKGTTWMLGKVTKLSPCNYAHEQIARGWMPATWRAAAAKIEPWMEPSKKDVHLSHPPPLNSMKNQEQEKEGKERTLQPHPWARSSTHGQARTGQRKRS
jgi:hypothetical protein